MAIDVTGINTSNINKIKQAIEDWAKAVDAANISVASKAVANAMKGSKQQAQVKALCQSCNSYANKLTATLKAYEARLDEVKTAYVKNDETSTAISDGVAAIKKLKS